MSAVTGLSLVDVDDLEEYPISSGERLDTRNRVSFVRGGTPEHISHVYSFHGMVDRIAMGLSGVRSAIQNSRNLLEGAAASAGVVSWNHRSGYLDFQDFLLCKRYALGSFTRHITKQRHHKYMRCIGRATAWCLFSQEDHGRTELMGSAAA